MFVLTAVSLISIASCGTVTNTLTLTNNVAISNYVDVMITNTPDQVIDSGLMNAVIGEWLITMETYDDDYQDYDTNSNIIYIHYVKTNTYSSTTNGGVDGAYSLVFKNDFYVDQYTYLGTGTLDFITTNVYKYSILSNEYGYRIDLEITYYSEETSYLQPSGPIELLSYSTNEYIVKTNYQQNYKITNIFTATNIVTSIVTETNDWLLTIERDKIIDSYTFAFSTNFIGGSIWNTNIELGPDTNYYQLYIDGTTKSFRQETVVNSYTYNSWEVSGNEYVNFTLDQNTHYKMKKIK